MTRGDEVGAELVVVGGGLAGLATALGAARHGVDTVLVHDRPVLGGNSSSEVRVAPAGAAHFAAWARETGIVEELLLADRAGNHQHFYENGLTNSLWDLTLLDAAHSQAGLRLFLNTPVVDVDVEEAGGPGSRRIRTVTGLQTSSGRWLRFRATAFCDGTGDGTVGALAGADHRYGREARHEHDEPLAPVTADHSTSGSTLCLRARDVGTPVTYRAPAWARRFEHLDELGPTRALRSIDNTDFGGFWWLEIGDPFHQVDDIEDVVHELRRHVLGLWDFLKNRHPDRDALRCHALEWVGSLPGKRESRRLLGDVVLTEHDCHHDRAWPDRVGTAGWYIDLHSGHGIRDTTQPAEPSLADENYRNWVRVAPFSVPLRALYSRNVENLWLAGRCLSATHVALGCLRVQGTLGMLGQATGIAAAHALRAGLGPRELAHRGPALAELRRDLLADGVRVLGTREDDPADLARNAAVRASSAAPLDFGPPEPEGHPLAPRQGQVFPVVTDRLEATEVHVVNDGAEPVVLRAELQVLETIWEQHDGRPLATTWASAPAGFAGWLTLRWGCSLDGPGSLRLVLSEPGGRVRWSRARHQPTGTCAHYEHASAGGSEPSNAGVATFDPVRMDLPPYRHWLHHRNVSLALRTIPEQYPFGAENAINGRAWPEDLPNLWVSDPSAGLPQHLDLDLGETAAVDAVSLDFDSDLRVPLGRAPGHWRAETCARAYRILTACGPHDGWAEAVAVTDNHQRRRRHDLGGRPVRRIRLEVNADHSGRRSEWMEATASKPFFDAPVSPCTARVYALRVKRSEPAGDAELNATGANGGDIDKSALRGTGTETL